MAAKEKSTAPVASYQVRFSPKVMRAERRRGFLSGLGVFLPSSVPFVEASIAIRLQTGQFGNCQQLFFRAAMGGYPVWLVCRAGRLSGDVPVGEARSDTVNASAR
jgi:hypothetical protein